MLYHRAQGAAPESFDGLHFCGLVAFQRGRLPEAIDLLSRVHRTSPRDHVCEMRYALALLGAKRTADAEMHFSHAVQAGLARDTARLESGQAGAWISHVVDPGQYQLRSGSGLKVGTDHRGPSANVLTVRPAARLLNSVRFLPLTRNPNAYTHWAKLGRRKILPCRIGRQWVLVAGFSWVGKINIIQLVDS